MKQLGLVVICIVMLGCSKEAGEEVEVPTPANRAIVEDAEAILEKEREWAIELEKANNERMAKKLGVSVEEYENLTIEEQKELIRKHRGRK